MLIINNIFGYLWLINHKSWGCLKSWGIRNSPWFAILVHGLMTWMIWGYIPFFWDTSKWECKLKLMGKMVIIIIHSKETYQPTNIMR